MSIVTVSDSGIVGLLTRRKGIAAVDERRQ